MKVKRKKKLATALSVALLATSIGAMPVTPAAAASLLSAEFETTNDSFTGRGGAQVQWVSDQFYNIECSLFVSGRTASWHGAMRDANNFLKGGETYALSAAVYHEAGEDVEMKFSLQYTDASGTTSYDAIDLQTVPSGEWVVLSNDAYTVPAGASGCAIYMETTESLTDFYLDSVTIKGEPSVIKKGDANGDLSVNTADAIHLAKFLCGKESECEKGADMNEDGAINAVDLSLLKNLLLFPPVIQGPEVDGDWDNYQEEVSPQMLKVYQDGLCRVGNTARIREKIAKAQKGENVTIGYIGGSITGGGSSTSESKRFVNLSYEYFKSTFAHGGNNVKFVNAGMAGTSSVVGNIRVGKDIFDKNCDIIFIEFAVNDQGDSRFQKSFESLVKKCLMQENEPAVVVITLCQKSGGSNQDWMQKVAENYDVPVISGKDAVMNGISAGTLNWDRDYGSGDTIHPGDGGHALIANLIGYYYRQALRTENLNDSYEIPNSTVYGAEYAEAQLVDISSLLNFNAGSWSKGTTMAGYQNGYTFSKNGNNPMTFTVEGKGILLLFQSNDNASYGTAVVNVNGKSNKVSSNLKWTWGGLDGNVGYYQPETGKLDISISMENPGSTFVLCGIAVIP